MSNEMKRIFNPDFLIITFITVISFILFFFRLGNTSLTNWDEAWFGSVAQDMAKSGNLLAGNWNGQIFFYEPPFLVWLLALTIKIFGESEFLLRSVSALSGVFTVIGCYVLAKKIAKSKLAGILASLVILSDIEILFRSRQINVEILLTVLLLWSIIFVVKAYEEKRLRWTILSAICLGLAFLTKRASPLLALPAIGYLLLKPKPALQNLAIFFITFITITFPWYLLSYLKWGDQFINEFFIGYTFNKIKSVNASVGSSPFFYLSSIKHAFKLWTPILTLIPLMSFKFLYNPLKQKFSKYEISWNNHPIEATFIFVTVFFFGLTLAPIKSSWFLLPIHPFLTILLGYFIVSIVKCVKFTKLHKRMKGFVNFLILFLVITVSVWQLYHYRRDYIVPDTTANQALISKLAGALSNEDQKIFLDDEYLPVAVFYSRKKVTPLRFSRTANPVPSLTDIPEGSLVLTNTETFPVLKSTTGILFEELFSVGDLFLVRAKGIRA
jgi:4-amino-4-deoxy-L-arabinose transferase-like glycosyltransferase